MSENTISTLIAIDKLTQTKLDRIAILSDDTVLEVPDFQKLTEVAEFFRKFYELNKTIKGFSYRTFAEKINWPHSYLNDVMSGRKPLTVSRAMEFARLVKLNDLEIEQLVIMALKASENTQIRQQFEKIYSSIFNFHKKVNQESLGELKTTEKTVVMEEFQIDPTAIILVSLLTWQNRPLEIDIVTQMCLRVWPHTSEQEVLNWIERLKNLTVLEVVGSTIVNTKNLFLLGTKLTCLAEIMVQLLRASEEKGPFPIENSAGMYRSGVVEFPLEKLDELKLKLVSFANWIGSVSKAARESSDYHPEQNPLIKYDLFFCGLIKKGLLDDLLSPSADKIELTP